MIGICQDDSAKFMSEAIIGGKIKKCLTKGWNGMLQTV